MDRIQEVDVLTGEPLANLEHMVVFPASHYVVAPDKIGACHTGDRSGIEGTGQIF